MKEKILEAFNNLGIELRYIESLDAYHFIDDNLNFLFVYDESHKGVLKIEVPDVLNCEDYSTLQILGLMEAINSGYEFLKAFVSNDCLYLSYERELMPCDKDLNVVILWMIMNLKQGCRYARNIMDEFMKTMANKSDAEPEDEVADKTDDGTLLTTGTLYNDHAWVDMGLSVKWATCNVGAGSPEESGGYYAWGELHRKSEYMEANSETFGVSMADIAGNPARDVARAEWGDAWRLPKLTEIEELVDKCMWTRTTLHGVKGYKVVSQVNGNVIFLPMAGAWHDDIHAPDGGMYWSSTPHQDVDSSSAVLILMELCPVWGWSNREGGLTVRPVLEL